MYTWIYGSSIMLVAVWGPPSLQAWCGGISFSVWSAKLASSSTVQGAKVGRSVLSGTELNIFSTTLPTISFVLSGIKWDGLEFMYIAVCSDLFFFVSFWVDHSDPFF